MLSKVLFIDDVRTYEHRLYNDDDDDVYVDDEEHFAQHGCKMTTTCTWKLAHVNSVTM